MDKKEKISLKKKKEKVSKLTSIAKNYSSVALISLYSLPDDLFQRMRKKLRDQSYISVAKKTVIERVLENIGIKFKLNKPSALIFTNLSPFKLLEYFSNEKKKIPAKPGQIAPYDIVVPAGETDLSPGPALSELKNAGLNVQVKAGKIAINKDSVIVKQGETITPQKAKALQMLGILPFEVRVEPIFIYDGKTLYSGEVLNFSLSLFTSQIQEATQQAINMAVNSSIYSSTSIDTLLLQAIVQANSISTLIKE